MNDDPTEYELIIFKRRKIAKGLTIIENKNIYIVIKRYFSSSDRKKIKIDNQLVDKGERKWRS